MITEQTERPRILLVDDDEAITGALAAFLGRSGFDVRVAEDGRAGLAEVEREVPDLVVCDVIMPHVDGREFVRRIRAGSSGSPSSCSPRSASRGSAARPSTRAPTTI